ncbi:hypothetical protein EI94DRAFT_1223747 [Lactarius quietus]|nr:hypothetical protein EI94DRAFT_1223747 [Lactarius quietus]
MLKKQLALARHPRHSQLNCQLRNSNPPPKYRTAIAVPAALSRRPQNATHDSAVQDRDTPHRYRSTQDAGSTLQCRICLCVHCPLLLELTLTQTLERRDRSSYDARSGVPAQHGVYGTGWRLAIVNRKMMRGSMCMSPCAIAEMRQRLLAAQ